MTPAELIEWLNAKGADKPCPACDSNDWLAETVEGQSDVLQSVAVVSTSSMSGENGMKFSRLTEHKSYLLSCKNCGFMRFHNMTIVGENG
jgi:predicted nucleic-acid-binding Zn-ribbon protein